MTDRKWRMGELLTTLPPLAWLALFFVIPTLIVFAFAFKPFDITGGIGAGWTLDSIYSVFTPGYFVIIMRTLWLSVLTTILSMVLSVPMAYYIARASARVRYIVLLLIVMPFWSSFIVRIFAWKSLLHPEGFIHGILASLHIIDPDTMLLYNAGTVLLVMVYSYLPFAILPIYAAAAKFNYHLFEAAMDLGMTRLQVFFKVFIPGIQRGIVTALLLVFIPAVGAYVIPDVVGGTNSEMIGTKIVQRTFVDRNLPLASALSALLAMTVLIPLSIIAVVQLRNGRRRRLLRRA